MKKLIALLLALVMVFALCACGNSNNVEESPADEPSDVVTDSPEPAGPVELAGTMTQLVTVNLLGNDIPVTVVRNFETGAFRIDYQFNGNDVFAEGFVGEDGAWNIANTNNDFTFGTIEAILPVIDDSAWTAAEAELVVEISEEEPAADPVDRADYGIPEEYTKVKIFNGTYGFGDAEIIAAMNDDETAFYIQFVCFDEAQILEGTVANGICIVTYDLSGFVSGDCQLIYDDALASEEPWAPLTGVADSGSEDVPTGEAVCQTVTVDMMGNATDVYVVKTGNHFEMSYSAMGNDVVLTGSISGDTWTMETTNVEAVAAFAGNIVNSVVAALDESAWAPVGVEPVAQTVTVDMMGNAVEVYVVKTGSDFELNYSAFGNEIVITGTIADGVWTMVSAPEEVAAFAGNIVASVAAAIDEAAWASVQ